MDHVDLLSDAASRPLEATRQVLDGITDETLHASAGGSGSSIAWLVWHAFRQQDLQVAQLAETPQVWTTGGWAEKLGVDRGEDAMGFGDTDADVAALRVSDPAALLTYAEAVTDATTAYARTLDAAALDDIIDESYDPPVRRGVRLVSVIDDAVAHLGQAAYARGVIENWRIGY